MCEAPTVPHKSLRRRRFGVEEPFVFLFPVSLCQTRSESGVRCFVPARLSVPLCLAGEAAVINKTQEVECSHRCTHRRLHCITLCSGSRHDFLLLSLHFRLCGGKEKGKRTQIYFASTQFESLCRRPGGCGRHRGGKYQSKSDVL